MTGRVIDLRSDTVTRPPPAMRQAMADAEVGDDLLDGDPTTRRLEARIAELLGHEAALFFPSGVQANEAALAVLTRPGTELLVDPAAHVVSYEMAAPAQLWGLQIRPVDAPDGLVTAARVEAALRAPSPYVPAPGAIAVENTHNAAGGRVLSVEVMQGLGAVAAEHGLPLHLDGARLWHAAAVLDVEPAALAAPATTAMVSFSKGLGCPVGSCLAGPRDVIAAAWIVRRRLGGAMRQSGILAAAVLYALDHHLAYIGEDHVAARLLAEGLAGHPRVTPLEPETNIVMLDLDGLTASEAVARLEARGVRLIAFGHARLRAVTHRDVSVDDVRRAAEVIGEELA